MSLNSISRLTTLVALTIVAGCTGPQGPKGDTGQTGPQGQIGPAGPPGSPDSAAQVLDKFNQATTDGGTADLHGTAVSAGNIIASFNVPTGTFVKVPYSSVSYDKLGEFNSTVSRFTATHSGEYLICAWLTASAAFRPWELEVWINGAREKSFAISSATDAVAGGCRPTHLNAADYMEVYVWQGSGSTQSFVQNGAWSWLTIHRLD